MHERFLKQFLRALIILGSSLASWAAASPAQDVFDEVIYFLTLNYGGFSGANIRGFEPKYQPQLDAACQDVKTTCPAERAYPIIQAIMAELNDKHTSFTPGGADFVRQLSMGGLTNTAQFGIRTTVLDGRGGLFVTRVVPGSPAAEARLQRGDWLVGLNNAPLPRDRVQMFERFFAAEHSQTPSTLNMVRQGRLVQVRLTARVTEGTNLPTMQFDANGVAIIQIPDFLTVGQVGSRVHALVRQAQAAKARGIVVDLRDNPGGFWLECFTAVAAFVPDGLVRRMVSRQPLLSLQAQYNNGSVTQTRNGTSQTIYTVPDATRWTGPVSILISGRSASCAEFFALDVQLARRGPVLGERTAGVGNTATAFTVLSDGSALQVTTSQSLRPDGTPFPEFVTPDISVQDDLLAQNRTGVDAVLERAISSLR